jgi:hypothetical protein
VLVEVVEQFNKMNETRRVEAVECVPCNKYLVTGGSDGIGDVHT